MSAAVALPAFKMKFACLSETIAPPRRTPFMPGLLDEAAREVAGRIAEHGAAARDAERLRRVAPREQRLDGVHRAGGVVLEAERRAEEPLAGRPSHAAIADRRTPRAGARGSRRGDRSSSRSRRASRSRRRTRRRSSRARRRPCPECRRRTRPARAASARSASRAACRRAPRSRARARSSSRSSSRGKLLVAITAPRMPPSRTSRFEPKPEPMHRRRRRQLGEDPAATLASVVGV